MMKACAKWADVGVWEMSVGSKTKTGPRRIRDYLDHMAYMALGWIKRPLGLEFDCKDYFLQFVY